MVVVMKSAAWNSMRVYSTLFLTLHISGAGQAFSVNFIYHMLTMLLKS